MKDLKDKKWESKYSGIWFKMQTSLMASKNSSAETDKCDLKNDNQKTYASTDSLSASQIF